MIERVLTKNTDDDLTKFVCYHETQRAEKKTYAFSF